MDEITEHIVNKLTVSERHAFLEHKSLGKPNLSLTNSLRSFELFLNGSTCEEVVGLNEGFTLGAVVEARVRDRWDQKRESQLMDLYQGVADRIKQTHSESVVFVSDLLSVAHKKFGPKIRKFLQTGMEEDLEGIIKIDSIRSYKELAELFLKISGLNSVKKIEGEVHHTIEKVENTAETAFFSIKNRPLTDEENQKALNVLERLSKDK